MNKFINFQILPERILFIMYTSPPLHDSQGQSMVQAEDGQHTTGKIFLGKIYHSAEFGFASFHPHPSNNDKLI